MADPCRACQAPDRPTPSGDRGVPCPDCRPPRPTQSGVAPTFLVRPLWAPPSSGGLGGSGYLDPPTVATGTELGEPPPEMLTPLPPLPSAIKLNLSSLHGGAGAGASSAFGSGVGLAPGAEAWPREVPGYRVERALGQGGMGTVFLARQLSLGRPVALKVMSRRWSADPVFVARFTREAYAAALLNHPNVVQIYDIGQVDDHRYFSMEYVPGRTLAEVVRAEGKLDCETAVGYVLQAARGLAHAHERGLIHRDVKPDNLLLDDCGRVKVADLGLVKTPATTPAHDRLGGDPVPPCGGGDGMTGTRMALGTPAYMAPEQCRDASKVDHRADIYSLGCTLYVLVTGRPPFDACTAVELMTKHAYQPITPPEAISGRVPPELSAVMLTMMAKRPDERYASMAEVVRALEAWLGVPPTATGVAAREEQIQALESCAESFRASPTAALKARIVTAGVAACLTAALLLVFFGRLPWAFGLAGFVVQSAGLYFALSSAATRTDLFRRARQFVLGSGAWDATIATSALLLFLALLWTLNLFWIWLGFGALAGAVAIGLVVGLDRAVEAERRGPLRDCQKLLRRMRHQGYDEEQLRLFVAKYAGRRWEEFFEANFGFEAKLAARSTLLRSASAGPRDTFAAWREPVLALIERVERARHESRAHELFCHVEQARLQAGGMRDTLARSEAERAASALLEVAGEMRGRTPPVADTFADARPAPATAPNLRRILEAPSAALLSLPPATPRPARLAAWVAGHFGLPTRAAFAGLLLGLCALWVAQTRPWAGGGGRGLVIDGVPPEWTRWVDSANAGWAGGLLLVSLYFRGWAMASLVYLGAAVCAFGPDLGIRTVEPVRNTHVAMLLGSVAAMAGFRLGRRGRG